MSQLKCSNIFIFCIAQYPKAKRGRLIFFGFYTTHSDTPQSVGLLWKKDRPVAENSIWQNTAPTTDRYPCLRLNFFLKSFSFSLFVLFPYFFLCLHCPGLFLCLYSTTHNTNIHAPGGSRTRNYNRQATSDPCIRPLDHWDRLLNINLYISDLIRAQKNLQQQSQLQPKY